MVSTAVRGCIHWYSHLKPTCIVVLFHFLIFNSKFVISNYFFKSKLLIHLHYSYQKLKTITLIFVTVRHVAIQYSCTNHHQHWGFLPYKVLLCILVEDAQIKHQFLLCTKSVNWIFWAGVLAFLIFICFIYYYCTTFVIWKAQFHFMPYSVFVLILSFAEISPNTKFSFPFTTLFHISTKYAY